MVSLTKKLSRDFRCHYGWTESAHYDAANFLLSKFDLVIQPWLHCSKLVPTSNRNISSTTVRNMLTMSHFKYRQRLEWASTRYPGRHVLVSEEPGTSKTCTNCGGWNANLGASDIYCCDKCNIQVGRDVAGARNNFFSEYGRAVSINWDGKSA